MTDSTELGQFLHAPLGRGLREVFLRTEQRMGLTRPVDAYLAGGMAVFLYVGQRVTTDVDAEFDARVLRPQVIVDVQMEDGTTAMMYLDQTYNSTLGLMHEDYQQDALRIDLGLSFLSVSVLSPVDLVVSKVSRLAAHDIEDIQALLRAGLVSADAIERRANDALAIYIGDLSDVRFKIGQVVAMAQEIEGSVVARSKPVSAPGCGL